LTDLTRVKRRRAKELIVLATLAIGPRLAAVVNSAGIVIVAVGVRLALVLGRTGGL